ncbi:uncharacterized protein LOC131289598 [Anopheles ziemanni]|uniref:uncharacterized protein LOC131260495 n=1 Tax=Anopheles coustani TaxID=139045 RepID=UPI00265A41A5|nr:uncharacterized protein LOC131260495 [Anopheles coustani]XP_058174873.1 uncharacterized protein LOC131289598 [Anopheles ziemanni]
MVHLLGFQLGNQWPPCSGNDNRLLSLFNLLCNTTQTTTITTRDACYGCFFRAGALVPGPAQLTAISQCASLYLINTSFSVCATNLAAIVTGFRPINVVSTGSTALDCYTGHCEFVQCVRRINGNMLINQCLLETLVNRDLNVEAQRIGFYVNATSCILARARCNTYNPITGQLQQPLNTPTGTTGRTGPNSLQISPTGDLRVIMFPLKVTVGDAFCSSRTFLDQSSFGNAIC